MNTDEVFKMLLLETSPERAGRVGYLRKLNAEKAKKSAEFWDNDDAWGAAKKAQQKYDSHTATVDRHMKKFSRDRDSDWAKKLAAGYKGEETDVKNMRRNLKIGAGVGLGLAGAYGAYRLLRGKKKPVEKEKATTPTKTVAPKKHVIDTRQDPTEPASYPFKDSASTDAVWANLMEGIWGRIKGAAAGLRDKFRDKVLDKYVAPAAHASVKFPGAEPHDSVTQGRITRMYRALGGKGMSPTLVRHKGNTGMAYMKVPAIGTPDGKLPVIAAPARGTRVVGQLRRGKGVVAGFHNSSGITHEVGHAALTSKGDISHKRMPMVDALNKRHPKNIFGGIAKLDPKTYATQARLHMRAEGRNNTFLGTSKNRLRAAKTSMSAAARSLYDDVKKHAPDEAPRFVQRYKNFRRAWRKGSPTAHLKLSADSVRQSLREVEYLPGGRAEGKPSRAFPPKQLRMGRKVEMEHTRNPRVAEEIAKDHLAEFKDYYTRLAQMERKAKRSR